MLHDGMSSAPQHLVLAAAHLNEALARAEDLRSRCATLAVELARATASRDEAARALAREEAAHADALRRVAAATEALASLSAAHLASRSPELAAALEDAQRQRDVLLELRKASLDEVRALKAPPRPLVRLFQMVRLSFARSNARVSLEELEADVAVATLRRARAAVLAHK